MSRPSWAALAVVVVGSAALLARPWLVRLPVDPVALLVVLFLALGLVGMAWRLPAVPTGPPVPVPAWLALATGLAIFGAGRLLAVGAVPPAPLVVRSVALNTLAAVAEEAFYRRFAYGVAAARYGPAVAVGLSAALFAAVHVTVWGWAVLPLDLAAGLVLGWQRWASGRWSVPATTHVAANVWAVV